MTSAAPKPLRVLVLCTGNSARSQMAEALFNHLGQGRVTADSAGSRPAPRVNPLASETLERHRIPWAGHAPQSIDAVERQPWDIVITVCDNARVSCPVFPGRTMMVHWGMPDPAEAEGDDSVRRMAFERAFTLIKRRIDLMMAVPFEKLERLAFEAQLREVARDRASGGV